MCGLSQGLSVWTRKGVKVLEELELLTYLSGEGLPDLEKSCLAFLQGQELE